MKLLIGCSPILHGPLLFDLKLSHISLVDLQYSFLVLRRHMLGVMSTAGGCGEGDIVFAV